VEYPSFIAIDASSWEESAHPVAIAWSLTDGTIKTTLIQPEEDWDDWDTTLEMLHGISQDTLYQRGETTWSVIRELENDLERPFMLTDDQDRCNALLESLYSSCDRDLSLETGPFQEEVGSTDMEDWYEETAFHHQPCDERVRLMLNLWADQAILNSI